MQHPYSPHLQMDFEVVNIYYFVACRTGVAKFGVLFCALG